MRPNTTRKRSTSTRIILTTLFVAGLAVAAVPAITSGQSSGVRTITVQEKVGRIKMDDLAPRSKGNRISQGDRLVTTQTLFSAPGKRSGTLYTDCTGVGPTKALFAGARLLCTISYGFADGQVIAAGATSLQRSSRLAIVGGTGVYEGASGSVEPTRPAKGFDSADVLRIAD